MHTRVAGGCGGTLVSLQNCVSGIPAKLAMRLAVPARPAHVHCAVKLVRDILPVAMQT